MAFKRKTLPRTVSLSVRHAKLCFLFHVQTFSSRGSHVTSSPSAARVRKLYAGCPGRDGFSPDDIMKITRVHRQYEEFWLKGDSNGVRSLFTDDCVLLPHHGDPPVVGMNQLNAFWFPPGAPPTTVTKLKLTIQNVGGNVEIAYAWGTDEVDHHSGWQVFFCLGKGNFFECPQKTAEWLLEDFPPHVGRPSATA